MPATHAPPGTFVHYDARMRFRVVAWDDVRPGDVVYYRITCLRRVDGCDHCYGPFTVVDPMARRLRNRGGVEFPLGLLDIQLVVLDPEHPTDQARPIQVWREADGTWTVADGYSQWVAGGFGWVDGDGELIHRMDDDTLADFLRRSGDAGYPVRVETHADTRSSLAAPSASP